MIKYFYENYTRSHTAYYELVDENGKLVKCTRNKKDTENLIEVFAKGCIAAELYEDKQIIGDYVLCSSRIETTGIISACNAISK